MDDNFVPLVQLSALPQLDEKKTLDYSEAQWRLWI